MGKLNETYILHGTFEIYIYLKERIYVTFNWYLGNTYSYRKALRMMYYADHHGFPIVTFIDTPGAYADLKSEELGQVWALLYSEAYHIHF